ncbi:MAG: hypothetical protein CME70_21055 [Halobacteriovorax sp.]|nr:hypothetical protein [Halobacteriovorax sp.]|tara:strand:- start:66711 stop:67508 length:798 start_codon:yes stop_codon:yes gene_type:complete
MPGISVLMSVFKERDEFLEESLGSLINQSYRDFEVILIDDGMTDSNIKVVNSFNDPRIKLIKNDENLGLTKSLNKAASLAAGKYLARLDSDDWSTKERLQIQFDFMEANPHIVVCAGRTQDDIGNGILKEHRSIKIDSNSDLKTTLCYFNPFTHSTLFMRADTFKKVKGYDENIKYAQDYNLIVRMAEEGELSYLSDLLTIRHTAHESITVKKNKAQTWSAIKSRVMAFRKFGGGPLFILYLFRSLISLILPGKLRDYLKKRVFS